MKTLVSHSEIREEQTMKTLINELEEECLHVINLINYLKIKNLAEDERESILGELSASVSHLKIHSGEVERVIDSI